VADLGWQELFIILLVVVFIFGAGKLPEIAKSLGHGVRAFRDEANSAPRGSIPSSLRPQPRPAIEARDAAEI
jgi:sec-independent protein translocase protein TatA